MRACFAVVVMVLLLLLPILPPAYANPGPLLQPATHAGPSWATDRPATRSVPQRWIVQLRTPSLVRAADASLRSLRSAPTSKLQVDAPAALSYRRQLQAEQQTAFGALQQAFPGAQLHQRYDTLFNGMGVMLPNANSTALARIRAMPNVAAVYPEQYYSPNLFSSVGQIGAPAVWNNVAIGGVGNAGAGIKIAIIDSGVRADNAFFNPAGFSYPAGFPRGDVAYTTPKVIAARSYFRPDLPPLEGSETPWPGPDDSSHGTHVGGIAAGVNTTQATVAGLVVPLSGVAPRAYLLSYKIFYANESIFSGSGGTIEILAALEDAVRDGADVINNSWGGLADADPAADPLAQAANAAVDAGVTVVFSAGNDGPNPGTAGSPAFSDKLISVGASTSPQTIVASFVDVVAPEGVPDDLRGRRYTAAAFGAPITDTIFGPAPYRPVASVTNSNLACDALPPGSLAGTIALIERGTCPFTVKVLNAQAAGAVAAMVYNSAAGGESLVVMAPDATSDRITIPAVFVQRSLGIAMTAWWAGTGEAAQVQLDPRGRVIDTAPDVLASFSSRGPTFQGSLKPDVVAPGVNILSSGFATGEDLAPHLGFGQVSGTSMAAPHVAGGAALLMQAHPDWSPLDIKSALMSTATMSVTLDEDREQPADILEQGAGRIDLARAIAPGLLFDRPNLSFGRLVPSLERPTTVSLATRVRNVSGQSQTYTLAPNVRGPSDVRVVVTPPTLTLGVGASAMVTIALELPIAAAAGNYAGTIAFDGPHPSHLPLLAIAMPAVRGPTVLLLDNDGSTSLELRDYAAYYAGLLDNLGVSYTYRDLDALAGETRTLPLLEEMQQHSIVLWFTGDNAYPSGSFAVPTPLTPTDQDQMIAYLQAGGNLIATGQDLTWASDINAAPDPSYQRSDLYHSYLGARFVQDDVYTRTTTLERTAVGTAAQPWLENIVLDLATPNLQPYGASTSAGNQTTVDEIGLMDTDPRLVDRVTKPILRAASTGAQAGGIIGLTRSAEPTLENGTLAFPYRSTFLAFGLEGVRNDTGTTTREALLQSLLYWHVDRPQVNLSGPMTIDDPTILARYTATATTNTPARWIRYRWDFGDGTPVVESYEPEVIHQYAQAGTYHVRVEAINSWGHHALSAAGGDGALIPEPAPEAPTGATRTFAQTGQSLSGRFLAFWDANGGLPVFGYPLEAATTAQPQSQVLERARFELHAENAAPYDVLLGHVGADVLTARGVDWRDFPTVATAPEGCRYFAATGHSLCGRFLDYWNTHGLEFDSTAGTSYAESLALWGLPLSEPHEEVGTDGQVYIVQWFERARFESHPEFAAPYDVLLGRLGAEAAER